MKAYSKKVFLPQSAMEHAQYIQKPRFNNNVFQIDFKILKDKSKIAMGDPIFCQNCKAALSCLSKPEKKSENEWKWVCEFCENENQLVNIEEEEIPKDDDLCFVVQSNNQANEDKIDEENDISVVFCMDFSGSMNVTQELKNQNELKIDNQTMAELENFKQFMEPQEYQQYKQMVFQQQNKFISRKDCVLAAIKDQLSNMKKTYPNRKTGLVVFNDDVVVIGDGVSQEEKVITGDKLYKFTKFYKNPKPFPRPT